MIDLLGEDDDGYWSATAGGLVCPRQNGKGAVIEALELAWLFLCDVELIFHSAHLFATASDAFRRIKGLIKNTPDLQRQVLRYSEAHGQEGIELRNGKRLRFVARSKSGGRGFPAPVVVLDEAFNMSAPMMAALVPTMAAQSNPFLLVTSSAPIDDPCSDVLRQFMRRSRSGNVERRCYIEYAADPDAPFDDQLRQANPGYGIRLNTDVIDQERELLTPEAFAIERLGLVDLDTDPESKGWEVVTAADWNACLHPNSIPGEQLAWAIDVDADSASASVGVSDGVHIEVAAFDKGTAWLAPWLAARDIAEVFLVGGMAPVAGVVEDLERLGVNYRPVTAQEQGAATTALLEDIGTHVTRHRGQPPLDAAAQGAVTRSVKDVQLLAWGKSTAPVSPLIAVTLARWAAQNQASCYEERGVRTL